jgi:hypothetical protein
LAGSLSAWPEDAAVRELMRHVLHCGGTVATVAVASGSTDLLQLRPVCAAELPDPVAGAATSSAPPSWPRVPRLDLVEVVRQLPDAQRFQGRIALLFQFAEEANWIDDDGDDRYAALRSGVELYEILAERVGTAAACASLSVLIGAVRSRNSLDNRLRNMPNDRLGLLLLVAVVRLARRARAFTMREICRELGAVATGT